MLKLITSVSVGDLAGGMLQIILATSPGSGCVGVGGSLWYPLLCWSGQTGAFRHTLPTNHACCCSLCFTSSCPNLTLQCPMLRLSCPSQYFQSVCELDIMFNLEKTHFILDEMVLNGYICEGNRENVLKPLLLMDSSSHAGDSVFGSKSS